MKQQEISLRRTLVSLQKEIALAELDLLIKRDEYTQIAEREPEQENEEGFRRLLKSLALQIEKQKIDIQLLKLTAENYDSQLKKMIIE